MPLKHGNQINVHVDCAKNIYILPEFVDCAKNILPQLDLFDL